MFGEDTTRGLGIKDSDDRPVVGFVDADQTAARQDRAGESAKNLHCSYLDRLSMREVKRADQSIEELSARGAPTPRAGGQPRCSIRPQASFSVTVRLKTRQAAVESGSTQKYPRRSNWYRVPGSAVLTLGSTRAWVRTSSDAGLRSDTKSPSAPGDSLVKRRS